MHFGATLRLLRLESGLGLRDLARRLNVSGAYLSRVENGLDSIPTSARVEAIAGALQIPAPLLHELAHRVSPLVVDYVDAVPEAGSLLLEIADRRLSAAELAELRDFLNQRFPSKQAARRQAGATSISELLTPATVILRFSGSSIDDVIDVAVGRLERETAQNRYVIASDLKQREREASSAIGGGVAVLCANTLDDTPAAVVVTLQKALAYDTPDQQELRLIVVLAGPRNSPERRIGLARVARLAARGLCNDLADVASPDLVIEHLARLELFG
ncbi:MAG TPA: helix-turn-helix domain-containing protein [Polyangiaceae bacterium]|nr:helix-turn-helix domain-containing protein [Polyangiaceae bacterium]